MSTLLTGSCPNCGNKLSYDSGESTVTCFACDSTIRVSDLSGNSGRATAAMSGFAAFTGFDNPESGVVFLENFFDSYDWEAYQLLPDIEIPEIDEVIGNNKVKNGAVPETWYLDFMGLYVPVSKKFEGLEKCEKDIIEKFDPVDPTYIFSAFDTYRSIGATLLDEKDAILRVLQAAIKYAERFSLAAERLDEMKKNLAAIEAKFSTIATKTVEVKDGKKVVVVDKIELLDAYNKAKAAYSTKALDKFKAEGIDAEGVYQTAVKAYNENNIGQALALFETIRDYSDSALYINKLNQYFDYFGEVYRFGGKHFIYKKQEVSAESLDLKKMKKNNKKGAETQSEGASLSALALYPIVDGVPSKEPAITGIEQVITCYGTKLFFFKKGAGISCYDLAAGVETVVDEGTDDLYKNEKGEYECGLAKHSSIFYVKKKFTENIKGCFGKSKGTKGNELNPYMLLLIDMTNNSCRTIVKEMVEIKLRKGDKIFYNFAYTTESAKGCFLFGKKQTAPKSRLMVCDIATGTTAQVLDDDCDICEVVDELVFYTLWKNNDLNQDLHVYDIANGTDTLIEKNIYDFFAIVDDKVYYTIGNAEFRPLVRANFDGSDREQVMLNVRKIEMIRGGWFYVTKGSGVNSALVKIRVDGKDAKVLCTAIKSVVRFEGNYIYYSDVFGDLRVVRIDGKDNRIIAEGVDTIFPAEDGLYYCRNEKVDKSKTSLSLYHMDRDGRNIKKIVFNVDKVQNDPVSNQLYFSKCTNTRYKVFKEGKEDKAYYTFFKITKFYSLKKAESGAPAEESKLYLTLGLPEQEEKKGCLAKFQKDNIYVEAPIIHSYKNRGLSDAEIMADEEEDIPVLDGKNVPAWAKKFSKNTNNKNGKGGCNNGCGCSPKK